MLPFGIHWLTKQTGNIGETPMNGTMFGWSRNFHTTVSL
jgi:hypothetical protein